MSTSTARADLHSDEALDLLRELVGEVRGLRRDLMAGRPAPDERYARLLSALAGAMGDLDLPFDAAEVLDHATVNHALDEALQDAGIRSPAALGAVFRSVRGRDIDGMRLVRDGRSWRLART